MMRHISPAFIGLLIVGSINVGLVTIIVKDTVSVSGGQLTVPKVEWKSNLSTSVNRAEKKKSIDSYKHILMQPLFYKNREPFIAPPPLVSKVVALAAPSDPGFVLAGVMVTSEMRKAYIFTKANNSGIWANEGDDYMGWKIRSVDQNRVRLEQSGRIIEVELYPPN